MSYVRLSNLNWGKPAEEPKLEIAEGTPEEEAAWLRVEHQRALAEFNSDQAREARERIQEELPAILKAAIAEQGSLAKVEDIPPGEGIARDENGRPKKRPTYSAKGEVMQARGELASIYLNTDSALMERTTQMGPLAAADEAARIARNVDDDFHGPAKLVRALSKKREHLEDPAAIVQVLTEKYALLDDIAKKESRRDVSDEVIATLEDRAQYQPDDLPHGEKLLAAYVQRAKSLKEERNKAVSALDQALTAAKKDASGAYDKAVAALEKVRRPALPKEPSFSREMSPDECQKAHVEFQEAREASIAERRTWLKKRGKACVRAARKVNRLEPPWREKRVGLNEKYRIDRAKLDPLLNKANILRARALDQYMLVAGLQAKAEGKQGAATTNYAAVCTLLEAIPSTEHRLRRFQELRERADPRYKSIFDKELGELTGGYDGLAGYATGLKLDEGLSAVIIKAARKKGAQAEEARTAMDAVKGSDAARAKAVFAAGKYKTLEGGVQILTLVQYGTGMECSNMDPELAQTMATIAVSQGITVEDARPYLKEVGDLAMSHEGPGQPAVAERESIVAKDPQLVKGIFDRGNYRILAEGVNLVKLVGIGTDMGLIPDLAETISAFGIRTSIDGKGITTRLQSTHNLGIDNTVALNVFRAADTALAQLDGTLDGRLAYLETTRYGIDSPCNLSHELAGAITVKAVSEEMSANDTRRHMVTVSGLTFDHASGVRILTVNEKLTLEAAIDYMRAAEYGASEECKPAGYSKRGGLDPEVAGGIAVCAAAKAISIDDTRQAMNNVVSLEVLAYVAAQIMEALDYSSIEDAMIYLELANYATGEKSKLDRAAVGPVVVHAARTRTRLGDAQTFMKTLAQGKIKYGLNELLNQNKKLDDTQPYLEAVETGVDDRGVDQGIAVRMAVYAIGRETPAKELGTAYKSMQNAGVTTEIARDILEGDAYTSLGHAASLMETEAKSQAEARPYNEAVEAGVNTWRIDGVIANRMADYAMRRGLKPKHLVGLFEQMNDAGITTDMAAAVLNDRKEYDTLRQAVSLMVAQAEKQ